jgi:hypothetical protein
LSAQPDASEWHGQDCHTEGGRQQGLFPKFSFSRKPFDQANNSYALKYSFGSTACAKSGFVGVAESKTDQ